MFHCYLSVFDNLNSYFSLFISRYAKKLDLRQVYLGDWLCSNLINICWIYSIAWILVPAYFQMLSFMRGRLAWRPSWRCTSTPAARARRQSDAGSVHQQLLLQGRGGPRARDLRADLLFHVIYFLISCLVLIPVFVCNSCSWDEISKSRWFVCIPKL